MPALESQLVRAGVESLSFISVVLMIGTEGLLCSAVERISE